MRSTKQTLLLALYMSLFFIVLASPVSFTLTNMLTNTFDRNTIKNGVPTLLGVILHTLLFFIVVAIFLFTVNRGKLCFFGISQSI